ncbi:helix-turn-helix transcriptional regulator [Pseudomaricurvus alkylphenolicus]|uniref:helix-turn-helix domain-containing protein n=1 Tax=Pseudomaricurvus alkylphenolicus TaxID=1306991 RepID=UPI00141E23B8|nr:helix-turn-helix transcriptional regulator [Pseudomaricurvus alkylphenolicus]NIB44714.1 helix-turn-helix transcriptional regulator [Pseudomaricurvus alkylphenolicus]
MNQDIITTVKIVDTLRELNNWTDYRVAKELGISTSTINGWRARGSVMNNEIGRKAAQLLGVEEKFIEYCLETERLMGSAVFEVLAEKEAEMIEENGGLESAAKCILC